MPAKITEIVLVKVEEQERTHKLGKLLLLIDRKETELFNVLHSVIFYSHSTALKIFS